MCCLAGGLFLAACSSKDTSGLAGLGVSLTGVERSANGVTRLHWQISNPNVVAYLVQASSHKVYLDGQYVGTAAWREPAGVARQSTLAQSVVIKIEKGGEASLAAAFARGSAGYRVESILTITTYGENREVFRTGATGTVPLTGK
jgi:hypothetical protein